MKFFSLCFVGQLLARAPIDLFIVPYFAYEHKVLLPYFAYEHKVLQPWLSIELPWPSGSTDDPALAAAFVGELACVAVLVYFILKTMHAVRKSKKKHLPQPPKHVKKYIAALDFCMYGRLF